ncbi:MAG: hypothetical protein ACOYM9_12665 [Bradymonadia bacterium]
MNPPNSTTVAALVAASLLVPHTALALGFAGFDDAVPQAPGKMQVGGGFAGGDSLYAGFGFLRLGLLDDLDVTARAGLVDGLAGDGLGFEVGGAPRFRFLRAEDTGVVDVAALGGLSLAKAEKVMALGVDPQIVASRAFSIDDDREVVTGLGLGIALTWYAIDGVDADVDSGFLGAAMVGVDIVQNLRLSLEGRLNDEIVRFGVGLSWQL